MDEQAIPDDVHLPHPIAGLLGHLSDRISLDHLEAVADRSLSLVLVGPRQNHFGGARFDDLVRRPKVCWVGERQYEQVPAYLRLVDVGLTPYSSSPFNQASSPLKTIEYLAAGRGSVSTDLSGASGPSTPTRSASRTLPRRSPTRCSAPWGCHGPRS